MADDGTILTAGRDRPYCTVCACDLPADGPKAIKQHLKSKPHKQAQKKAAAAAERGEEEEETAAVCPAAAAEELQQGTGGEEEEEEDYLCEMCARLGKQNTYHTVAAYRAALERGEEDAEPCLPPPFHRSAKAVHGTDLPRAPFMTTENGWVPDVPEDLEECLDLYCNVGANGDNQPPNIDINGVNTKPKSLSKARRMLQQAEAAEDLYWAALAVDAIKHPAWWPRQSTKCVGTGDVPQFNQVIVGNGPTDIGIHIDNAPPPCMGKHVRKDETLDFVDTEDPQYEGVKLLGMNRVHVHTYITMARGKKWVIMMPPGKNFFPLKSPFPPPREVTPELMARIQDAGGYYFALEPVDDTQHATLFTPKGWHHWLLGATDWHVIFGASRF
eukprot:TRINITY_DN22342_c0_g1_i1.p1 TRINITY_DN22342_c0_g1~~TRINITY_DN22342_c0_g1_i1.p1  ORF type:complete len:386 (+),score=173.67 TRINITY_DN22342_c0_g1_i1:55-1212(+)